MKRDGTSQCKFKCNENIDKDTNEKFIHVVCKLETGGKHSYINQTSGSAAVAPKTSSKDKENVEVTSRKKNI